nr:baseplate J/gp47 family protein [uncultured Duganella sp.]
MIVTDGRDQQHRRPPALCGDYFRLNEMSFEQLLALAVEYARLVRFFNLELRAEGDWQAYFSADDTVLMASILALDSNKMLARFEQRLQRQPVYHSWFETDLRMPLTGGYLDTLDSPLLVARLLDIWLTAVRQPGGHAGHEVRTLLEGILSGLRAELGLLVAAAPSAFGDALDTVFSAQFIRQTGIAAAAAPGQATPAEIRYNFHTLIQAVRILQNGIRSLLPPSLLSGDHDPGISLLIGFVRMFQQLLARLNRFGDQRIDFYYQRVLGMQAQPQKPDSAFLVIRPTANARLIHLDAGTEFIGGVDADLQDIIFATDSAATLNDAHVTQLHSLYFERLARTGTCGGYHHRFQMLRLETDEREHEKLPPMPLMGAPKPGDAPVASDAAAFGFMLSSKVLLMREGERSVRVQFQYHEPKPDGRLSLEASLRQVLGQIRQDPKRQAESGSIRTIDVFVRLFRSMFRISVTSADGWHPVAEYRPEYHELNHAMPDDCLAIEFVLPASAPAVTPYDPAVHGGAYDSKLPLLRFDMTQNEYRYPYDLLTGLILRDIRIDVAVRGLRQLLLHNQIGQLSALAPFMPFGPLPAVGAYMVVGCEEILYKHLRDVSLDVEWAGLPTGLAGFPGYYRGYAQPLKSDAVTATVAVLADGRWQQAGGAVKLFRYVQRADGGASNLTSSDNTISLSAPVLFYKPVDAVPQADASGFQYTSASMTGLFKLTLAGPAGALGHQEYPALLSRVLTVNAQQKKPLLMQPLPNPPYTPQISRIALNYKASATIAFERNRRSDSQAETDSFIHLHPLGWQSMFLGDTRTIRQIPRYTANGQLFIGIEGKHLRGTLSLYFYLREDSLPLSDTAHAGLRWRYLCGNSWQPIRPDHILDDSTKGFMTSGIVLLRLPEDIDLNNTIMPAGQFWLCVSADDCVERFCSMYAVYAQAVKVTWRADRGAKPQAVMPAMRIVRSREHIAGIDSIFQVRRSFDGKAAETPLQFRVRASERLRHKQRALTASDYEQLILERFPQVFKVKCFPNLKMEEKPAERVCPGHVLIVAVPHLGHGRHVNQRPTLSGHVVNEIQQYVRQFASPDAVISVQNPVYEEVQVRCTVELNQQQHAGRLIELINRALCEYLSPWNGKGIHQHFGWTLRQHDVVSFLLDLGYVKAVTSVSLLRISPEGKPIERRYSLYDNARHDIGQRVLQPSYPWSIAVPMNLHDIAPDQTQPVKPVGIRHLRIGSTFIIQNRREP